MRVLRLPRPELPESDPAQPVVTTPVTLPGAAPVVAPVVASGLEGFDSESGVSTDKTAPSSGRAAKWLTGLLVALVAIETVPAALWARQFFTETTAPPAVSAPVGSTTAANAPTSTESGSTLATAAACEPAAVNPVGSAPATDAAAATDLTTTVVARPAAAPIAAGVLSVASPLPLHIYARGKLVGTTETQTVMLPLGVYELDLVNDSVGYRTRQRVVIQAGRANIVRVEPPTGVLHIQALPWAEVWMDDQRLGETPLGNVEATLGYRELIFRHPELGERRTRVLVTLSAPGRVSMDLRKP